MDLVGSIVCGHLNHLHAQREREMALEDLQYIVTTRVYWEKCKYKYEGRRIVRGLYKLSMAPKRQLYLVNRVVGQLQRHVLTPPDVIDAVISAAKQVFPRRTKPTRECPWCEIHIKEHIEAWRREWGGQWPPDDALVAALALARSLTEEADRHSSTCCFASGSSFSNAYRSYYRLMDQELWIVVGCGKILLTHSELKEDNENGRIWLPVLNDKDPLGCHNICFPDT